MVLVQVLYLLAIYAGNIPILRENCDLVTMVEFFTKLFNSGVGVTVQIRSDSP